MSQTSTGIYLIHIMVGYSLERIVTADIPMLKNVLPVLVCIISTFVVLLKEKIKDLVVEIKAGTGKEGKLFGAIS